MNALPALSLDDDMRLTVTAVVPDGPVIKVTPVHPDKPMALPPAFLAILKTAKNSGEPVSHVICRRAGVPESQDKSHLQHFLVSTAAGVRPVDVTY
ncbi:MAG: hypothetical protein EBQ96_06825 [Proteobacteria bacterium]|nr:hypothetical protein [Pseudomonadota bacterium]